MRIRSFAILCRLALACLLLAASAAAAPAQGLSAATKGVPLPGTGPRAYVAVIIDDLANLQLWSQLAEDADAYGIKTTLALNTAKATPDDYALMSRRIAAGHEVANHTRDHVPVAPGQAIRLRYANPAAKSAFAVVDEGKQTLSIIVNQNPEPAASFDLSEAGHTPSLKQLVDALNDVRGVTAELGDPYNANLRSSFLAASARTDIFFKNGFAPLFMDTAKSARYEMTGALTDIKAGMPDYTVRSMIYPFLVSDAATRAVTVDLGMTCGRVGPAGNAALGSPDGYDLYRIYSIKPRDVFGTDVASPDFAAKVAAFLKKIKEVGGVLSLYSHGPDEFTNEQWKVLLPMLAKDKEVAYVTLHGLEEAVKKLAVPRDGKYYLAQGK
ncbi:chitin deacetylase [Solidesulfovibrio sp.]|uniref:chitin deacetylase n=1 Tax=Solidesulfovibrio sp. TaxID=2910990 RepID=UPI000ED9F85F|nr:chitin deacetylase [Solidesulfovibrio sp.]MEA5088716.1 chitin deacetylase [Solidesulfovibrio sp.]HCR13471.1 chitin deacetylase [Desulfovibrio sp.]HML60234.1 chitin deacetylase [Solidesulfovibrio sp.]